MLLKIIASTVSKKGDLTLSFVSPVPARHFFALISHRYPAMDNSFFIYLERLEILAFFAGYPLLYALVYLAGRQRPRLLPGGCPPLRLLCMAYGITGLLFLGMLLKNLYPDYSLKHIGQSTLLPGLKLWGLAAILFLLPILNRKPVLSLLHGSVFFFFVAKDVALKLTGRLPDADVLKNDMKMVTNSLITTGACFAAVLAVYLVLLRVKRK
jgi:hypothetical protein